MKMWLNEIEGLKSTIRDKRMIYKTEYKNKETGSRVLVLMIDDYYAHYQQDGFIKYALKYDFTEQFEIDDSAIMEQGL